VPQAIINSLEMLVGERATRDLCLAASENNTVAIAAQAVKMYEDMKIEQAVNLRPFFQPVKHCGL
jgi:hypothetical protein